MWKLKPNQMLTERDWNFLCLSWRRVSKGCGNELKIKKRFYLISLTVDQINGR